MRKLHQRSAGAGLRRLIIRDRFSEQLPAVRKVFDERMANPLLSQLSHRFVWDYWHVPGQYSVLRTPADDYFEDCQPYKMLESQLLEFGESELGCHGISPLWLSNYTSGHRQELHADTPHGPWAFVLSLTKWDSRRFTGGETVMLNDTILDYWSNFDANAGLQVGNIQETVDPEFNRLIVFDGRVPHGVRVVEGEQDPRYGRLVLHGWFTDPAPFFKGALEAEDVAEEVTDILNTGLEAVYGRLEKEVEIPCVGVLTLRMVVGKDGRVSEQHWLSDTLAVPPRALFEDQDEEQVRDELKILIGSTLASLLFPKSGGDSVLTVPFVFQ